MPSSTSASSGMKCASQVASAPGNVSVDMIAPGTIGANVLQKYAALSQTLRVNNSTAGNIPSWILSSDVFTKMKVLEACRGNTYPQFVLQTLLEYVQPMTPTDRYKHKYELYTSENTSVKDVSSTNRQTLCQKLTEYCTNVNSMIDTIESTYCKPLDKKDIKKSTISELLFPHHCLDTTKAYMQTSADDSTPRMQVAKFIDEYLGPFVVIQMWTKYIQGSEGCSEEQNRRNEYLMPLYVYHILKVGDSA